MSGALLAIALVILGTRLFGLSHLLTSGFLGSALALAVVLIAALGRTTRFDSPWRSADRTPLFLAAIVALATALVAAWLLPVGQWDSLGYHLPYVNFALQGHATVGVPDGAPDISTYPHAIKLLVVALRALLPDDRLVDLAQIPFAILAAIATAGLSRKVGAHRKAALGAGAAWLGAAIFAGEALVTTALQHANPLWLGARNWAPSPARAQRSSRDPRVGRWRATSARTALGPGFRVVDLVHGAAGLRPALHARPGPIFLAALIPALVTLWRLRSTAAWLAILAAVLAPDPSVVRCVLAMPARIFAFSAPRAQEPPERPEQSGTAPYLFSCSRSEPPRSSRMPSPG